MALCDGSYALPADYAAFWCLIDPSAEELAAIEPFLLIGANDIHVALAASGACDCTPASWAEAYLAKLNIIDARIWHQCPCGKPTALSDSLRQTYLRWIDDQLTLLRTGKLDICAGATGADFPAIAWAGQTWTSFSAAELIYDHGLVNS